MKNPIQQIQILTVLVIVMLRFLTSLPVLLIDGRKTGFISLNPKDLSKSYIYVISNLNIYVIFPKLHCYVQQKSFLLQIRGYFWSVFSCIWTECVTNSVRIQEHTDQK